MKKTIIACGLLILASEAALARRFQSLDYKVTMKYSSETEDSKKIGHKLKGTVMVADDGAFPKVILSQETLPAENVSIRTNGWDYSVKMSLDQNTAKAIFESINSKPSKFQNQAAEVIKNYFSKSPGNIVVEKTVKCEFYGRGGVDCDSTTAEIQIHSDLTPESLHVEFKFEKFVETK